MEEFEVCTFCGEVFYSEKIPMYRAHYEKCREEYEDGDTFDNFDWEQDYY